MDDAGETGRRGRIYRAMKVRAERGVTAEEIDAAGISFSGAHISSLMFEGHGILSFRDRNKKGTGYTTRYVLERDAWA